MLEFCPYLLACYFALAVVEFADALSAFRGVFARCCCPWMKAGCLCGCVVAGVAWPVIAALWLYAVVRETLRKNLSASR
jgi:hypothetical protein